MTDPQPGIPARYEIECPLCRAPIHKDDRIAFDRGRPIHCRCAQEAK